MKKTENCDRLRAVLVCLQNAFVKLESTFPRWHESNDKAEVRVKSIANLIEQLETCTQVHQRDLPAIADLNSVKQLLVRKIKSTMEEDVEELQQCLIAMDEQRVQMDIFVDEAQRVVTSSQADIDFNELMTGTATRPSVADMLEWLDDVKCRFGRDCVGKMMLADNLWSCDSMTARDFLKHWRTRDPHTFVTSDIWPRLHFFLHDSQLNG